jgi:carboxyl-terminal processing protease
MRTTRRLAAIFAALTAIAAPIALTATAQPASPPPTDPPTQAQEATRQAAVDAADPYAWFDPIVDIQRLVATRFVTEPDLRALQIGAISGMLETLDDRYTVFIPEESIAEFDKALRGEYVGIGASVNTTDGWATIVSPLDESPALAAGLLPGDRILEVDGQTTMGEDLDETIERIIGEEGTTVTLTIEREGEQLTVPIVRRPIVTRSTAGFVRDGATWDYLVTNQPPIGYIRLVSFGATAASEFREALAGLQDQGARGLIIDLRDNSGGLLGAAIQIADLFLEEGAIVSTRGRAHDEETYYASPQTLAPDMPLLVLINRRSASASEVLAGALADNDRAVVLGERSFGKGLVQNVLQLPSGAGQLKITEQRYYGPSGKLIQREDEAADWGIDPTDGFFVAMTNAETATALRTRAQDTVIREDRPAPRPADDQLPEDWVRERYQDLQLAAAIEAMRTRLTAGEWTPVSETSDDDAPARQELFYAVRARDYLLRELERANQRIDALGTVASAEEADELSILPDDAKLTGGLIEIRDADGNLVRTLEITGDTLERYLVDAPVQPAEPKRN